METLICLTLMVQCVIGYMLADIWKIMQEKTNEKQ